ncbi:hypothetical protein KJJ36_14025 [Staphylococcus pseudoxylosus]|uniref:hypothetical protein n=1 Tax=Staphylococcus pseudoxylosus TaxID=2282419 RepID=UPI001F442537|nr:hypothetical protein [Staphylococcus pseudoxylosus]MCE5003485.1 hypothetical protein [Staphylococcus pseudoxylosus]
MKSKLEHGTIRNIFIMLLAITLVFLILGLINSYNHNNSLREDIKKEKATMKQTKKENKKIEAKEMEDYKNLEIADVDNASNDFNDKFFNWDSWKTFSYNMKDLRTKYPNLEDNEDVDISGKSVGTGESPVSSFDSEKYTTTKKKEISEYIIQSKKYNDHKSQVIWQKVSNYENGKYDITKFDKYEQIL